MRNLAWIPFLCGLLVGCSPMEQRSDLPEKKQLSSIEKPLKVTKKWGASAGKGVGKHDVKLLSAQKDNILYTADHNGLATAFDMTTGKQLWLTALNEPVSSGPTIGEGRILVGTTNGQVIAMDMQGNRLWSTTSTSEILAAPKITDGMALVHTMDGGLSSFSMVDGRQLWRFTHNLPPLMLRRSSMPVVDDNKVIAGFANGKILALRKQDGAVDWSYDVAQPKGKTDLQRMIDISADPVVDRGIVYVVSYQGNLVALNTTNGQMLWERDYGSFSGFAVEDDTIYLSGTQGNIYAIDADNGDTYWQQSDLEGRRLSKPAVMGNHVVVADEDGGVHWIEKNSGMRVGRYTLDRSGVEATPIISNNTVYILGRSGKLAALEVE